MKFALSVLIPRVFPISIRTANLKHPFSKTCTCFKKMFISVFQMSQSFLNAEGIIETFVLPKASPLIFWWFLQGKRVFWAKRVFPSLGFHHCVTSEKNSFPLGNVFQVWKALFGYLLILWGWEFFRYCLCAYSKDTDLLAPQIQIFRFEKVCWKEVFRFQVFVHLKSNEMEYYRLNL